MIIMRHGKMERDGELYVPCIGDGEAARALQASQEARSVRLVVTKGTTGTGFRKMHTIRMTLTCPYCGKHHSGGFSHRNSAWCRQRAEERLYGVNEETGDLMGIQCKCGALYHKENSQRACQTNL